MEGYSSIPPPQLPGYDVSLNGSASSRLPKLPPCRVCGNNASGFHYGVNTCEACKGFFRRTLAKGLAFTCTGNNGQCPIIPKKRNACQSCRYKKCIEVGMSKNAIKTGRYTHMKRAQDITEIKTLENQGRYNPLTDSRHGNSQSTMAHAQLHQNGHFSSSKDVLCASNLAVPSEDSSFTDTNTSSTIQEMTMFRSSNMTVEEPIPLDPENAELLAMLMRLQNELFEELDSFLDEEKMSLAQKEYSDTLDTPKYSTLTEEEKLRAIEDESYRMTEELAALINTGLRKCISFVKKIPGWKEIQMEDQINLIKESQVEFWLLGHYLCLNEKLGVFTGEFNTSIGETKAEKLYDDKYLELLYITAESFKSLHLSKEEVAILRVITLTFSDREPLIDAQKVEKVHWRMVECLKSYYASLGINFNRRFAHIIDRMTEARTLTDAFNKLTKNVIRCWTVIKKYPLLEEFYSLPQPANTKLL